MISPCFKAAPGSRSSSPFENSATTGFLKTLARSIFAAARTDGDKCPNTSPVSISLSPFLKSMPGFAPFSSELPDVAPHYAALLSACLQDYNFVAKAVV